MKRIILVLLMVLGVAVFTGCRGIAELEEIYVQIEAEPIMHGNGFVSFVITTNLPDDTSLMLTLQRAGELTGPQTHVTIERGAATSVRMSDQQQPISGTRILLVSMGTAGTQSESVREVIGANGEALAGPLVRTASSGSAYVRAEFEFDFSETSAE